MQEGAAQPQPQMEGAVEVVPEIQEDDIMELVPEIQDDIMAWDGYKLVGDNLEKTIKPRYMTMTCQSQLMHYFNTYAIKDRINLSGTDFSGFHNGLDPDIIVCSR